MKPRRIIIFFVCFLTILVGATYFVLQQTGAARILVERLLARFIRSDFGLGDASLDPTTGRVTLKDFSIAHPRGQQDTRLVAGNVELDVDTNPLGDVGAVHRVKVERLDLSLDLSSGEPLDLREVLQLPEELGESGATEYPAVSIAGSRVSLRLSSAAQPLVFTGVELELLPEKADSPHMVLTGSMVSPHGNEVKVAGSANFAAGEFRALVTATGVTLGPEIARGYSESVTGYLERAGLAGIASKVTLWVEYPTELAGGGTTVGAGGGLEVESVSCALPEFPYPLRDAEGKVSASTRDGGVIRFRVHEEDAGGRIEVRGVLDRFLTGEPRIDVQVTADDLTIGDELARAVASQPDVKRVWDAFRPRSGRADLDMRLRREPGGDVEVARFDLGLESVKAAFHGFPPAPGERRVSFPYDLDVRGLVQLRSGVVTLREIVGERPDGTRVTISGRVRERGGGGTDIELDIAGSEVAFSDELRDALGHLLADGAAIYDDYAPRGKADLMVRLTSDGRDDELRYGVSLRPLAASAAYGGFPYRLDRLRGLVRIDDAGVAIDLTGGRGEAAVEVDGRFLHRDGGGMSSELWILGDRLVLDEALETALRALSPDAAETWRNLQPSGVASCQFSMWSEEETTELSYDLRVDVKQGTAKIDRLPLPLSGVHGSLFVHGTGRRSRTDLSTLRGEIDNGPGRRPATFLLQGSLRSGEQGDSIDLTTVVRGLQLHRPLAEALDHGGVFELATWEVLAPSGSVDVIAHHRRNPGAPELEQALRVRLADVSSAASVLPRPATELNGELRVEGGTARFENVRAKIGDAEILCHSGSIRHEKGKSIVDARFSAEHFPVDDELARLMTGPMREVYLSRDMSGAVRITDLRMKYVFPDEGDEFELECSGQLLTKDVAMLLVVPITEINGIWTMDSAKVNPDGGVVKGRVSDVSFNVLGHRGHSFKARFEADPGKIEFAGMSLRLHGGNIMGNPPTGPAITYQLHEGGRLGLNVRWNGLSLSEFLRASGQQSPQFRGTLSGHLDLDSVPGGSLRDVVATGSLRISDGRLGAVPLFRSIYTYLPARQRPQFDGARMNFAIRDGSASVSSLELTSPLMTVTGRGRIDMDGYVDMVMSFPDLFVGSPDWLLLPGLFRMLTNQVVRFHVYGYLRSPRARPRWLWQGGPGRVEIGPIPPPEPERRGRGY